MKNEKNITERVSTVNCMLTPPPRLWVYLFQARLSKAGGGDRDGGLIWEEGLNKFSQDDGTKIPKELECKVNKLFMRSWRAHYKLKIKNKSELPQTS